MEAEFVVGPFLCSKRFLCGYSGIPLSLDTYISKFQMDMARMDTFQRFFEVLHDRHLDRSKVRRENSTRHEHACRL